MTSLMRMGLRKLGRTGLVILLTILSSCLALGLNFLFVKLFDLTYIPAQDIFLVLSITIIVTPLLSWYLVGLLFKIDSLEIKMAKLAKIDSLTNIYNRGYFYAEGKQSLKQQLMSNSSHAEKTLQNQSKPAVLVIDLDDLKTINDRFGHAVGDKVLISLSAILAKTILEPNLVGRLGGDEFGVYIEDTTPSGLQEVIDVLLEKVRACSVEFEDKNYKFTVSIGAAFIDSRNDYRFEKAIKMADSALYDVKQSNRDGSATYDVET
ncbi:MAG: GGDEF domain-containing protein [Marinomonas sp.]